MYRNNYELFSFIMKIYVFPCRVIWLCMLLLLFIDNHSHIINMVYNTDIYIYYYY